MEMKRLSDIIFLSTLSARNATESTSKMHSKCYRRLENPSISGFRVHFCSYELDLFLIGSILGIYDVFCSFSLSLHSERFPNVIATNILADAVADYTRKGINEFNYIHLNIQNRYKTVMY